MRKSIVLRMTFALVSVGLMMFSLVPNLPTNAQDKDTCEDLGWTPIDASQVDLKGNWTGTQNRNCKESASWQYGFTLSIEKVRGTYYGKIGKEDETAIEIDGSKFTWTRNLTKGAGEEKPGVYSQTWRGTIEKNANGRIRIYGTWTGAYQSQKQDGYNLDFMLIR